MLVEEIGREAYLVPNAPSHEVADRFPEGLSNGVEARDLNCSEGPGVTVERVFAGNQVGLRAAVRGRAAPGHLSRKLAPKPRQTERIHADDAAASGLERRQRSVAAVGLADARDAIGRGQLDDSAESVRGVKPIRAAQRRIGDRDRVQAQTGNLHGRGALYFLMPRRRFFTLVWRAFFAFRFGFEI